MRRTAIMSAFLTAAGLLALSAMPGCGKKEEKKTVTTETTTTETKPAEDKRPSGKKTLLEAKLGGTIKGKVVYDGTPPEPIPEADIKNHKDKDHCLAGKEFEKVKQQWLVNKDKGVANVVVFLEAPKGTYFPIDEKDKNLKGKIVKLEQPHCAFIPHVQAAFPRYFDGAKEVSTGEVFEAVNNAEMAHNTKWEGRPFKTQAGNENMPPGAKRKIDLVPDTKPIRFVCDFHPWMNAFVWAFDHPYFAVTDMDGNFEIKNVPTGVEVNVVAWHEAKDRFMEKKETFKAGDTTLDLKVSK